MDIKTTNLDELDTYLKDFFSPAHIELIESYINAILIRDFPILHASVNSEGDKEGSDARKILTQLGGLSEFARRLKNLQQEEDENVE